MPLQHPPKILTLMAHELRWSLMQALTESDRRVAELVDCIGQPPNLVSYHLKKLRDGAIVSARRSDADGRDVYYTLDLWRVRELYAEAGAALHPVVMDKHDPAKIALRNDLPRVLFLCTHNSARSQMAEGLMRHLAEGRVQVFSAGSHPTTVHPEAIRTMDALDIDIRSQESAHVSLYEKMPFDYVVTVCDNAREVCPTFPGEAKTLHWGFSDPADIPDAEERRRAFEQIASRLRTRITYLLTTL